MPIESDPMFDTKASLPYAGTTGHQGGASGERALREARDGTAQARQAQIIAVLSDAGPLGATWAEIDQRLGINHHGKTSGALSSLHKEDRVAALRETRGGSGIYVLPQHVQGRELRSFAGRQGKFILTDEEREGIEKMEQWLIRYTTPDVRISRAAIQMLVNLARRAEA